MRVAFIIPFHNEEKNCQPMIERVVSFGKKEKLNFKVIAVDDKSTDKTGKIIQRITKKYKNVFLISRRDNKEEKGNTMGKALIEGTKKAQADSVIWTMGDMSDDVATYKAIIEKIKDGYDMVFGSRYMPGGSRGNLGIIKAFLSSWGTRLARFLFGIPVHDITNAFRGFRRKVFDHIDLESSGFSISPEFAIKAHLAGFKLGEVPTVYTNRREGVSNFKLWRMAKEYLLLYLRIFFQNFKKLRQRFFSYFLTFTVFLFLFI